MAVSDDVVVSYDHHSDSFCRVVFAVGDAVFYRVDAFCVCVYVAVVCHFVGDDSILLAVGTCAVHGIVRISHLYLDGTGYGQNRRIDIGNGNAYRRLGRGGLCYAQDQVVESCCSVAQAAIVKDFRCGGAQSCIQFPGDGACSGQQLGVADVCLVGGVDAEGIGGDGVAVFLHQHCFVHHGGFDVSDGPVGFGHGASVQGGSDLDERFCEDAVVVAAVCNDFRGGTHARDGVVGFDFCLGHDLIFAVYLVGVCRADDEALCFYDVFLSDCVGAVVDHYDPGCFCHFVVPVFYGVFHHIDSGLVGIYVV